MLRTIKIFSGIVLLMLLVSVTVFAQDLNQRLLDAATNGHTETVTALLAQGADVNAQDKYGATALILAAQNGYAETVETLSAKGADASVKNNAGWTALMIAA